MPGTTVLLSQQTAHNSDCITLHVCRSVKACTLQVHWLSQCVCMQLFLLLEAEAGYHVSSDELMLAVLSWLKLCQPLAAHAAWQRHTQLTAQLTAAQQQAAFQAALAGPAATQGRKKRQLDGAIVAMAMGCCLLAARLGMPQSCEQLQQLVSLLLEAGSHRKAYKVSQQHQLGRVT